MSRIAPVVSSNIDSKVATVTAEVAGSSPVVPAIILNNLG
jgi:hypothetical protein